MGETCRDELCAEGNHKGCAIKKLEAEVDALKKQFNSAVCDLAKEVLRAKEAYEQVDALRKQLEDARQEVERLREVIHDVLEHPNRYCFERILIKRMCNILGRPINKYISNRIERKESSK